MVPTTTRSSATCLAHRGSQSSRTSYPNTARRLVSYFPAVSLDVSSWADLPLVLDLTSTAFSLATLSSLTPPSISNRSLIFRSFIDDSYSLVATTDLRSPKVRELREVSNSASICWWMPTPNVQFRIKGSIRVIPSDEKEWDSKRKETWEKMSGHLRATFARPNAPGSPMDDYDQGKDWEETIPASEEVRRLESVCDLRLLRLADTLCPDSSHLTGSHDGRSEERHPNRKVELCSGASPSFLSKVACRESMTRRPFSSGFAARHRSYRR